MTTLYLYIVPPAPASDIPRVAAELGLPVGLYEEWTACAEPRPTAPVIAGEELCRAWGTTGWEEFAAYRPEIRERTHGRLFTADTIEAAECAARAWRAEADRKIAELRAAIAQRRASRRATIAATVARPGTLTVPEGVLDW
jgi:hypothetical protein